MRVQKVLPLALALSALSACGPIEGASSPVRQVELATGGVRSATVNLRLAASVKPDEPVGFELTGPIGYRSDAPLPVARADYVQFAGSQKETFSFISTGHKAFIGVRGKNYELPSTDLSRIRDANALHPGTGMGNIHLARWLIGAEQTVGPDVAGAGTDHFSGRVDVVQFFTDVAALARGLGGGDRASVLPPLDSDAQRQLRAAVQASTSEVLAGRVDHVARRIHVDITFAGAQVPRLKAVLGDFDHVSYSFDLALADINKPVSVDDPAGAVPLSQMSAG